jgi:hypothetical protein
VVHRLAGVKGVSNLITVKPRTTPSELKKKQLGATDRARERGQCADDHESERMDRLLSNKFQIGGKASAAPGPVGRHAAAGTDSKLDTEILSYSRVIGVFAGIALNGALVHPDTDAIRALYSRNLSPKQILLGQVPPPPSAQIFLAAGADGERQAKTQSFFIALERRMDHLL